MNKFIYYCFELRASRRHLSDVIGQALHEQDQGVFVLRGEGDAHTVVSDGPCLR